MGLTEIRIPAEIIVPVKVSTRDLDSNEDGSVNAEFVLEPDLENVRIECRP